MKIQYRREWSCAQNQAIEFIKPLSRRTKTIWESRRRKQGKDVERCSLMGKSGVHAFIIGLSFLQHLERHDQSRQIYKLLLELGSLDLRLPLPLSHPLRLFDLLHFIHFLHIFVLLISGLGLIINIDDRNLTCLISLVYLHLNISNFLHSHLIRVYLHDIAIFLMVVFLSRLIVDHLQQIILNLDRLILAIQADHIVFIPHVLYRNLMEVRSAGEEMIGVEVDPRMEAVKLQLNIGQEIFIGELVVEFILVLDAVSFDLLLSNQLGELPIYDATLFLISQQQVITFELLLSCKSHPFLRGDGLVIIFQHFLAYDIADCVDDVEEVIVKLVLALHLFYDLKISCFSCSFYKDLRKFMKLDAFIFLLQWFQAISLLDPLYLFIVVFANRKSNFFDICSAQDGILGCVEIDDVVLDLIEELAHLQHLGKNTLAQRCRLADAGFIVLPQQGNVAWWQLLSHSSLSRGKVLTYLKLHE